MVAPRRFYSLWQNALTALSSVMSVGFAVVIHHELNEAPGGPWLPALAIVILVAWSTLSVWLTVRSIRLGVYRDGDGGMTIRSLVRTWTIRVDQVRDIQIFEGTGSWSRSFYLPVMVVDEPKGRRTIFLWWLSAMTEPKAQDFAAHIQAMMVAARKDTTTDGGRG